MLALLTGFSLLLFTSVLISALLKLKAKVDVVLFIYLSSFTQIVLITIVASLFNQLGNRGFLLASELVLFIVALLIWFKQRKPALHILDWLKDLFFKCSKAISAKPTLILLTIAVLLSLTFQLILIIIMPPNTHDSLTTHISRVGYWIQNNSIEHFRAHNERMNYYPINPALQALWIVVLTGNDLFIELGQLVATLVCSLVIFGISRSLGRNTKSATFNGLIFLTFPIVVLQGSTTQTDLLVASLIGCAFYFLIRGFHTDERKQFWLASLAISVAIGSKQYAFFLIPGAILTILILSKIYRRNLLSVLTPLLIGLLIFFPILGGTTYILNYDDYQGLVGPSGVLEEQYTINEGSHGNNRIGVNSLRLIYNFIDPSGLPHRLKDNVIRIKSQVFNFITDQFNLELEGSHLAAKGHSFDLLAIPHVTEDETWYGPVGFLLIIAALLSSAIRPASKNKWIERCLMVSALLYFIWIIYFRPGWDLYQGRYFLCVILILLPLVDIYSTNNLFSKLSRSVLVVLAIIAIVCSHFHNESKPITITSIPNVRESIWEMDRIDKITIQHRGYRYPYRAFEAAIPSDSVVGLMIPSGVWDYPLFKEDFSQKIIPIYPIENLTNETWMRENKIDFVIINTSEWMPSMDVDFLELELEMKNWIVFSMR